MIYLTAQPDDIYFLWQLKLQLFNFAGLGIRPGQIHVLIGFDKAYGLNPVVEEFIKENKQASFFTYPDKRIKKDYPSSIRPNIIYQHFQRHKKLEEEIIFYHDSDILFRQLPPWDSLTKDEVWYVSDTSSYIGVNYILEKAGEEVFNTMCNIIGISPYTVKNSPNPGGAQYLIKNAKTDFWKKIEQDSENIYTFLREYSEEDKFPEVNVNEGIQAWCADMWAFWWNALLWGKKFQIHPLLEFCWANSPIEEWEKTYILHYTGNIKKKNTLYFRKGDFCFHEPFYEDLSSISRESCSYPLLQLIYRYKIELNRKRHDLNDVSFILPIITESEASCSNLYITLNYLSKYIITFFIIVETGRRQWIETGKLPLNSTYIFQETDKVNTSGKKLKKQLLDTLKTKYVVFYDADLIVPVTQLGQSMEYLRKYPSVPVLPYNEKIRETDVLTKTLFSRLLTPELLLQNIGKTRLAENSYSGKVLFCKKETIQEETYCSFMPCASNANPHPVPTDLQTQKIPGFAFKLFRREAKTAYI